MDPFSAPFHHHHPPFEGISRSLPNPFHQFLERITWEVRDRGFGGRSLRRGAAAGTQGIGWSWGDFLVIL